MKKILFLIIVIMVTGCINTVNAQTKTPDKSITVNTQTLFEQYFKPDNAGVPRCTSKKATVMITSVPHAGKEDCPPSRFFKGVLNRFLFENNLQEDVILLYVYLADCDLKPFKQITDDKIVRQAPYILVFDKYGKLNTWDKTGRADIDRIKKAIMCVK